MIVISATVDDVLLQFFKEKGVAFRYIPKVTPQELLALAPTLTGLVLTTRIKVTKELIDAAPNLKWVGRLGSGLEMIDINYLQQKGIPFFSTPEGNCLAVAEHSLGMLLSLMQKINSSSREVEKYIWLRNENRGVELSGKTVGVIGYGHTGTAFSALLQPFQVILLAHDKYKNDFAHSYIRECSLPQIQKYADVISFHLPLTPETHHYANEEFFNGLQKKPFIINSSRGAVIDTEALINALKKEQIAGAALDVLENEKLHTLTPEQKTNFDFLVKHPRVLLTPHIAGYTYEAFYKMSVALIEKLKQAHLI